MKSKILNTALKHFALKGYKNTSLDDIAKELEITKPAIYYHFKNKNELYNQIFIAYFSKLTFEIKGNIFEDIKNYISTLYEFFSLNPLLAKLFSKEISCEFKNLNKQTLTTLSLMIKTLNQILKGTNINPFFIQNMIISSLSTYLNTIQLREKITSLIECCKIYPDFNLKEEITTAVINYIKAKL